MTRSHPSLKPEYCCSLIAFPRLCVGCCCCCCCCCCVCLCVYEILVCPFLQRIEPLYRAEVGASRFAEKRRPRRFWRRVRSCNKSLSLPYLSCSFLPSLPHPLPLPHSSSFLSLLLFLSFPPSLLSLSPPPLPLSHAQMSLASGLLAAGETSEAVRWAVSANLIGYPPPTPPPPTPPQPPTYTLRCHGPRLGALVRAALDQGPQPSFAPSPPPLRAAA